jgi:hypothetical protein
LELMNVFSIKNLGEIKYILGIKISRDIKKKKIYLNQTNLIKNYCEKFGIQYRETNRITPYINDQVEGKYYDWNLKEIQERIGSLQYLARFTRPDISTAVGKCARRVHNIDAFHCQYIEKILKYLGSTKDRNFEINGNGNLDLTMYTDADWGSEKSDSKSISGIVIFLGKTPIFWTSKKQNCVATSTMESEIIAMSIGIKQLIYFQELLTEINFTTNSTVYCDNQAAIEYCKNKRGKTPDSRHIRIRYHLVRDEYNSGKFKLAYIESKNNLADTMTKELKSKEFLNQIQRLNIRLNWENGGV